MRDDVEAALRVLIDAVVARARPVAVAVDERHVEREELQRAVDVEDRHQRGFELLGRRLVQAPCTALMRSAHDFGSSFDLISYRRL